MSIECENGVPFLKMHGLGNDFVVLDARARPFVLTPEAIAAIGDRRTGVGFDQMAVIEPARRGDGADCALALYNADGSATGACGNATRCVASLLFAEEPDRETIVIRTAAGLLTANRAPDGMFRVDMGPARLDWRDIPLAEAMDTLHLPVSIDGLDAPVGIGMGNPHAVFFVPDIDAIDVETIGAEVEHLPLFPEKTNVEFAQILSPDRIRMRVWERGTGVTPACGSGACATLAASARRGLTGRKAEIVLDGGPLTIEWRESDGHVLMTGPVALSFSGCLPLALLSK